MPTATADEVTVAPGSDVEMDTAMVDENRSEGSYEIVSNASSDAWTTASLSLSNPPSFGAPAIDEEETILELLQTDFMEE